MNYDRIPNSLYAKGMTLQGDSSTIYPLTRWMVETFGMVPRKIEVSDAEYLPELTALLQKHGFQDALEGTEGDVEAVFTDGLTTLRGRLGMGVEAYVEIGIPLGRYVNLTGRTIVGTADAGISLMNCSTASADSGADNLRMWTSASPGNDRNAEFACTPYARPVADTGREYVLRLSYASLYWTSSLDVGRRTTTE